MTNKKYRKHNGQFARRYEGLPMFLGYLILITMLGVWAWVSINNYVNRNPLISPVAQVHAQESVIVSCEDPRGYLECQVHQGKINWEQHEKISRIIQCESNWNPEAINTKNKNGSYDMGLVQINSIHKNIKNSEKLDFKKSIDWMINKIKKDGGYQAWSCARILNIK